MHKTLIITAALSALALPALAAPNQTPFALSAAHADFQAQLEQVGGRPDDVGAAARAAAGLMAPHNAAQERSILPLLGWTEAASVGRMMAVPELPGEVELEAALARLYDGDATVVTALVELYAEADAIGDAETARLAERIIWHETADIEVLYPAALLVASSIRTQALPQDRPVIEIAPGPLYGSQPVPMMGVGNPHGPAAGN